MFFAMFFGQMTETKDSIELPDCEYKSLLELFRFLYSDKMNLSGNNVMQVLYLANKYMVPALVEKCPDIVKGIRFPLIPQKDFASVVFDSRILNYEEFGNMTKYYNGLINTPLPFLKASRIVHRCCRFKRFCSPRKYWDYGMTPDSIILTIKKPVKIYGVQHFGSEGGEYTVTTDIVDLVDNTSLASRAGNYASEKSDANAYYGFDVLFDRPVILKADKEYKVKSLIKGPKSWYSESGQASVECQGVQITFPSSGDSSNGTNENRGQLPGILFSVSK